MDQDGFAKQGGDALEIGGDEDFSEGEYDDEDQPQQQPPPQNKSPAKSNKSGGKDGKSNVVQNQ